MISIKEYLEHPPAEPGEQPPTASSNAPARKQEDLLPITLVAYRSALAEMGNCGQDACPALGEELKQGLGKLGAGLCAEVTSERVAQTEAEVRKHLQGWGQRAAQHYCQKTNEVKDILLVMARTASSVGERDQRCAQQINAVTTRLKGIANLEDLTEIRDSIKQSAAELKTSIDRMSAEGKAAIDQLKAKVTYYQTRLEEAETMASRDALTGVRSRPWVEGQIEQALQGPAPFCVAILDIDKFKLVNDEYGHLAGDELLKQFATKMRSVCRVTDTIGRWGGDEFILLLHCRLQEARAQIDRMREWVCGRYSLEGGAAQVKLLVHASIGVAERQPGETMKEMIDRADAEMYREKAAARDKKNDKEH
jgi:diguanylate cyclase (GGDEF)-like protein